MSEKQNTQPVNLEDLAQEVQELTPEEAEAAQGGLTPQIFMKHKLGAVVSPQPTGLNDLSNLGATSFHK